LALAKGRKAQAQVDLLQKRIDEASIKSPISGTVIGPEDMTRFIRRPVKTGDVLFEVAPVENLRAVLEVPEDEIAEVRDQTSRGELATTAYPGKRIGFVVDRINPVAEQVDQKNVYKVRVTLDPKDMERLAADNWTLPGMKGVAKIDLGKKPYYELWTRKVVNWVRMKLWI
jgi:multidrug efflux pump subunit AcrA (membrane-fusion protein)